jgi:tryptophan synthase beta chain
VAFAREERLVPVPEPAYAIQRAIDEAIRAREERQQKTILFNLSGHGLLDLSAYQQYMSGEMQDYVATDEEIAGLLANLPAVDHQERSTAQSWT